MSPVSRMKQSHRPEHQAQPLDERHITGATAWVSSEPIPGTLNNVSTTIAPPSSPAAMTASVSTAGASALETTTPTLTGHRASH